MILDSFKTHSAIIQIRYADAFLIWDRAGKMNRQISKIWPGVKITEGVPQQVTLTGEGVKIQTGIDKSTITLSGEHALGQLKVR